MFSCVLKIKCCGHAFPYGLVVRIPGFHPGGPGSIPGVGRSAFYPFLILLLCVFIKCLVNSSQFKLRSGCMLRKHLEGNYPGIISNPFTPKIDQFQISPAVSYQKYYITQYEELGKRLPYGLVVRIPGFHPGGPGSIPGVGRLLFSFLADTNCRNGPMTAVQMNFRRNRAAAARFHRGEFPRAILLPILLALAGKIT